MLSRISALFTHLGHHDAPPFAPAPVAAGPREDFSFSFGNTMLSVEERERELPEFVNMLVLDFAADARKGFGEELPASQTINND